MEDMARAEYPAMLVSSILWLPLPSPGAATREQPMRCVIELRLTPFAQLIGSSPARPSGSDPWRTNEAHVPCQQRSCRLAPGTTIHDANGYAATCHLVASLVDIPLINSIQERRRVEEQYVAGLKKLTQFKVPNAQSELG